MHWTVLVLRLHTQQELDLAKRLLSTKVRKAAAALFAGGAPRTVRLQGLDIMNDDPKEANVVFVKARDLPRNIGVVDRLQELCLQIRDIFLQHGLSFPTDTVHDFILHATICNAGLKKSSSLSHFDAGEMLAQYADAIFGDYDIHSIELSATNSYARGNARLAGQGTESYYAMEDSIEF